MVLLTGLTPDTNYSIVVTATNTAGFRNSSDAVVGATPTGRKSQPFFRYIVPLLKHFDYQLNVRKGTLNLYLVLQLLKPQLHSFSSD